MCCKITLEEKETEVHSHVLTMTAAENDLKISPDFSHSSKHSLQWIDWTNTETPNIHCDYLTCVCVRVWVFVHDRISFFFSPAFSKLFPPWSVRVLRCGLVPRTGSLLLLRLVVVLQEEVVTGHSESADQDDELGEIYLPVVVGIQVSHHLVHCLLILGVLHVWGLKKIKAGSIL